MREGGQDGDRASSTDRGRSRYADGVFVHTRSPVNPESEGGVWSKSFSGEKKANVWENLHPWGKITAAGGGVRLRRSEVIGSKVALWKKRTVERRPFFPRVDSDKGEEEKEKKNQYLGVAVRGDGEGGGKGGGS